MLPLLLLLLRCLLSLYRELEDYCHPWGVTLTLTDTLGFFRVQALKVRFCVA